MKQPQLSQFTPSTTNPFRPTRVFHVHTHPGPSILASLIHKSEDGENGKSPKIDIFDITTEALSDAETKEQLLGTAAENFKPHEIVPLVAKLEHIAREVQSPFVRIAKGGWYKRHFEATRKEGPEEDGVEKVVARLDGPLLDMGHWKLTFPAESQTQPAEGEGREAGEATHEVELRPTGPGSNTDVFVLNSVPYIWEMVHGREVFRLWRCGMSEGSGDHEGDGSHAQDKIKGVRREVGVYIARNHRDPGQEGVLVLDDGGEEGVDAIVGIMTCLGTCNQVHSFRK